MANVAFSEGLPYQLLWMFELESFAAIQFNLALTADTIPFSGSETFGSISIAVLGGVPIQSAAAAPDSIGLGGDTVTAQFPNVIVSSPSNVDSVTLHQWLLYDATDSVFLWGGSLIPPWTPNHPSSGLVVEHLSITLATCVPPPPPPPTGILLLDRFGVTDGTLISSDSPAIGGPWSLAFNSAATSSSITVAGNQCGPQATSDAGISNQYALFGCDTPVCTVVLRSVVPGGLSYGPVGRWQDAENYWWAAYTQPDAVWQLYEAVAGTLTLRASTSLTLTPGTLLTMTMACSGDTFTCTAIGSASASVSFASSDLSTANSFGFGFGWPGVGSVLGQVYYAEITSP